MNNLSELQAQEFNTLPLLFDDYEKSRIVEIARRLRALQIYPVGAQFITYKQAALFLYLLCSDRGPDSAINLLDNEPLKDITGETFISAFAAILSGETSLQNILEVFVSPYFCEIKTTETVRTFGADAKGEGFTFRKDKLFYYKYYLMNGMEKTGFTEQIQRIKKEWLQIEPDFEFPGNMNKWLKIAGETPLPKKLCGDLFVEGETVLQVNQLAMLYQLKPNRKR